MNLIDTLERQTSVLRARDVAILFQVTRQHIYKMAAKGAIPSFRVAGAIRFDPQELAMWLRRKAPMIEPERSSVLRQSA
jgi:excisionase family DNA binding protein